MKILTTQQYDQQLYEPVGLVSAMHVITLSILRKFLSGLAGIFGTDKDSFSGIEEKFEQARDSAGEKIKDIARKMGGDIIVGANFNLSEMGSKDSVLVCHAYGTVLKKKVINRKNKNSKKGGRKKSNLKKKSKKTS
tara:strand:+ start:521 stop:928 length:408 start_codon:yes stop_codon:yes gene_type:complete